MTAAFDGAEFRRIADDMDSGLIDGRHFDRLRKAQAALRHAAALADELARAKELLRQSREYVSSRELTASIDAAIKDRT